MKRIAIFLLLLVCVFTLSFYFTQAAQAPVQTQTDNPANGPTSGINKIVSFCSDPSQTIYSLYQNVNSHAAIFNSTFSDPVADVSVCYDSLFGRSSASPNPWSCNGANTLFYLDSPSNSHASATADSTYNIPVCYGDLACVINATCSSSQIEVGALSSATNAHVSVNAQSSGYPLRICCTSAGPSGQATWSDPASGEVIRQATPSTIVNMSVDFFSNDLNGKNLVLSVYEDNDTWLENFSTNVQESHARYQANIDNLIPSGYPLERSIYFIARYYDSSGNLGVQVKSNSLIYTSVIKTLTSANWTNADQETIYTAPLDANVVLSVGTKGYPAGDTVNIEVYQKGSPDSVDSIQNIQIDNNGNANTQQTQFGGLAGNANMGDQYYFLAYDSNGASIRSNDLTVYKKETNIQVGYCFEILQPNKDDCNNAVPIHGNPITAPNCNIQSSVSYCQWNDTTNLCETRTDFFDTTQTNVASCISSASNSIGACVNGVRQILVDTRSNNIACSDPITCNSLCPSGSCEIPCGQAIVALPFFTSINLILVIGLLVIIYAIIESSKRIKKISKK